MWRKLPAKANEGIWAIRVKTVVKLIEHFHIPPPDVSDLSDEDLDRELGDLSRELICSENDLAASVPASGALEGCNQRPI